MPMPQIFTKITLYGFVFILFLTGCSKCSKNLPALFSITGNTMGTTYSVKIVKNDSTITEEFYSDLQNNIKNILKVVNLQMSTYIKESEISRFNSSRNTNWHPIAQDFAYVANEALKIGYESGGALDITIGPIVNLWGFGPPNKGRTIPDSLKIEFYKSLTGLEKIAVRLNPPAIKKYIPEMYIDLSAIAKGFGVDKVASYLDENNIKNYMIEIGGEIIAKGKNQHNKIWQIGISNPDNSSKILKIVALNHKSLATSGDYQNYFEINNKRYSHTLDPRTGKPITHKLVSVSVIHKSTMLADGYATAINVLGPREGFKLATKLELPVLMIVKEDGEFIEIMTQQFEQILSENIQLNN